MNWVRSKDSDNHVRAVLGVDLVSLPQTPLDVL